MYELVEEAMKVLREPTDDFDFDNPPEDPKEIESTLQKQWNDLVVLVYLQIN